MAKYEKGFHYAYVREKGIKVVFGGSGGTPLENFCIFELYFRLDFLQFQHDTRWFSHIKRPLLGGGGGGGNMWVWEALALQYIC